MAEAEARELEDDGDHAAWFLSKDEWSSLPDVKKYQMALDRYKLRRKSKWEIGREYERYIGYHWEQKGHDVVFHGAIEGFR